MAKRTVFSDKDNNEMDCFINDKGDVYIAVGPKDGDVMTGGYITLDKEDVKDLISVLTKLETEM